MLLLVTESSTYRSLSQTTHNLYLCFDLCTGGELFDRICAKGNYYEACVSLPYCAFVFDLSGFIRDAADLVRTIMRAVDYIHGCGIVHRGSLARLATPLILLFTFL